MHQQHRPHNQQNLLGILVQITPLHIPYHISLAILSPAVEQMLEIDDAEPVTALKWAQFNTHRPHASHFLGSPLPEARHVSFWRVLEEYAGVASVVTLSAAD